MNVDANNLIEFYLYSKDENTSFQLLMKKSMFFCHLLIALNGIQSMEMLLHLILLECMAKTREGEIVFSRFSQRLEVE